jgi:hypothetical protein
MNKWLGTFSQQKNLQKVIEELTIKINAQLQLLNEEPPRSFNYLQNLGNLFSWPQTNEFIFTGNS